MNLNVAAIGLTVAAAIGAVAAVRCYGCRAIAARRSRKREIRRAAERVWRDRAMTLTQYRHPAGRRRGMPLASPLADLEAQVADIRVDDIVRAYTMKEH